MSETKNPALRIIGIIMPDVQLDLGMIVNGVLDEGVVCRKEFQQGCKLYIRPLKVVISCTFYSYCHRVGCVNLYRSYVQQGVCHRIRSQCVQAYRRVGRNEHNSARGTGVFTLQPSGKPKMSVCSFKALMPRFATAAPSRPILSSKSSLVKATAGRASNRKASP